VGGRVFYVKCQGHQLFGRSATSALRQRRLADERGFIDFDEPFKARFKGIKLSQNILFPVQVALFKPHRIHCNRAKSLKAMGCAGVSHSGVGGVKRGIRNVDFVRPFAEKTDRHNRRRSNPDKAFTHRKPGKRGV